VRRARCYTLCLWPCHGKKCVECHGLYKAHAQVIPGFMESLAADDKHRRYRSVKDGLRTHRTSEVRSNLDNPSVSYILQQEAVFNFMMHVTIREL
jgi:hypothetical protein